MKDMPPIFWTFVAVVIILICFLVAALAFASGACVFDPKCVF